MILTDLPDQNLNGMLDLLPQTLLLPYMINDFFRQNNSLSLTLSLWTSIPDSILKKGMTTYV